MRPQQSFDCFLLLCVCAFSLLSKAMGTCTVDQKFSLWTIINSTSSRTKQASISIPRERIANIECSSAFDDDNPSNVDMMKRVRGPVIEVSLLWYCQFCEKMCHHHCRSLAGGQRLIQKALAHKRPPTVIYNYNARGGTLFVIINFLEPTFLSSQVQFILEMDNLHHLTIK